jgi:hypothetical protein
MTQVLAVESAEDKVDLFLLIWDVAEGSKVRTEVLHWDHRTRRIQPNRFLSRSISDYGVVRLCCKHIVDLSVTEEKHHTLLHNVLEDKVLIIVANLDDIWQDEVIDAQLPALVVLW